MSELVGYTRMECVADAFEELARILTLSPSQLRKQLDHQRLSDGWMVYPPGAAWGKRDGTTARTTKRSPGGSRIDRRTNLARVRHLAPDVLTPFQEQVSELRRGPFALERKARNARKRARRAA